MAGNGLVEALAKHDQSKSARGASPCTPNPVVPTQHSNSDTDSSGPHPSHRSKHKFKHQKHTAPGAGRLHARIPSSRALQKQQLTAATKLVRKHQDPPSPERQITETHASLHRRAYSDAKLTRNHSSTHLKKVTSQSSLRRNRSHADVSKRNTLSEKLKVRVGDKRPKPSKTHANFDIGIDDLDDEWVDACGSGSAFISPKSGADAEQSRSNAPVSQQSPSPKPNRDRDIIPQRGTLTPRLLQRISSHVAPPKMTSETAPVNPADKSPNYAPRASVAILDASLPRTTTSESSRDELISRFIGGNSSGLASEGSFYQSNISTSRRSDEGDIRRLGSLAHSQGLRQSGRENSVGDNSEDGEISAARGPPPSAEKSRTQQKLNLQRASSVIEPGQAIGGGGGVIGTGPLLGAGGAGYDGNCGRDPRVSKLLDRTGMEYLVVRRYQNPVARSLVRLEQVAGLDRSRRIQRNGAMMTNLAPSGNGEGTLPGYNPAPSITDHQGEDTDMSRPMTPGRASSTRANEGLSNLEPEDDAARMQLRLSGGSSLLGVDGEGDAAAALLRNLWEKSFDMSASQD